VRPLARFGTINGSRAAQVARHAVQQLGAPARAVEPPLAGLFRAEWERCLGQSRFDSVVDFIGYNAFIPLLLLQADAANRSIWLHNDMVADSRREVGGRQPLRRRLQAVFTLYRYFDRLVSVSPALDEVNRTRLARYAPAGRFTFAQNVIDADTVRARAAAGAPWQPPAPGVTTFVAAGRLSHAKNFPRLVGAYAAIRGEFPDTRVVILGEGPDRAGIEAEVARLGVADGVLLAGHQADPYPSMAAADCLVMSSDHEGQPMTILEALVLGLPVVTTAFASVASALPAGQGLVVPRSVEGLAEGMRAFLRGEVPAPTFDAAAYNAEAVAQFLRAVGLGEAGPGGSGPGASGPGGSVGS
jgi:glycosyltransferase involved in cell wall biosynthesis